MKNTAAIIAFLIAGIGLMIGAAKLSEIYLVPMVRNNPEKAAAIPVAIMKPVEKASLDAMNAHADSIMQREHARKDQLAAQREAAKPKAYRWKDKNGRWVINDQPPPEGVNAEVIEIPTTLR